MRHLPLVLVLALTACNEPPDGLAISLDPEVPTTADDLVAQVTTEAVDPDDDDVTYTYAWTVDGENADVQGDTVPAERTARGQVWSVTVIPSDGTEVGPSQTAQVTIANTLPTATVLLTPAYPDESEDLVATLSTEDLDGDVVDVSIAWFRDGAPVDVRGERVDSEATLKGEVWEVRVTPSDDVGDGETVTAQVTIGNTAPSVASAAIAPTALDRTSVASCVGTGWEDVDGDPEGYQVAWSVDGTEVGTEDTLVIEPYARGSKVRCTLTPFDGQSTGVPVQSPEVTVGNAVPTLTSLTIGPADPRTGTVIEPTLGDLVDPDGDDVRVRYQWTVDGADRGTGSTLPGNRFVGGQAIVLTVTLNDGTDDGLPVVSNTLNAANTPPVISEVVLTPASPDTSEDVVATVTAADADGDAYTLSFEWTVDGSVVAETSDTLSGEDDFDKHDSIVVTVIATDTEDGTPFTSETIYAINTPPPAPDLAWDPVEPSSSDDATCVIDRQEPDLDEDSLTYTFAWTVDGTAFTGATTTTWSGDTVPSSARSDGEEWVCTVTPHDGDDNGDVATLVLGAVPPDGIDVTGTLSTTAFRRGSMTGATYNDDCPTGEVLVGIAADLDGAGGFLKEMAPRCAPLEVSGCDGSSCTVSHGTITQGTWRGGSGTYLDSQDCPSGSVVTGFGGRAGWYLDQLQLRCHPVEVDFDGSAWSVSLGSYSDVRGVGSSTGGSPFTRTDCTTGQIGTRATIGATAGGEIDGFQLGCQTPTLTFE